MTPPRLPSWFVPTLLLLACSSLPAPGVRAEDDDDPVEIQKINWQPISREDFDLSLFRSQGTSVARNARNRLETQLVRHVDEIARRCDASAPQRKKLQLAGTGDITRYFDRVEALWEEMQKPPRDAEANQQRNVRLQELRLELLAGLSGQGSLFEKAVQRTLTGDQWARYEQDRLERRAVSYRARIDVVIAAWDSVVPLRAEQRRRLSELLAAETRPPRWFGELDVPVVLVQAARIPEARFREILDDEQWRLIHKLVLKGEPMRLFLERVNLLEPDALRERGDSRK